MADQSLCLYTTEDCRRFAEVEGRGGDIEFPPEVGAWTEVLDCRVEPYTEHTLDENCHLAQHVRKKYILVDEAHLSKQDPTA